MSDSYQGAQDSASDTTPFNSHVFVIQQELAGVRTAMPVKVVKAPYDKDGNPIPPGTPGPIGFIDVQPLVNQLDGRGTAVPHGTVHRITYHRYQSGAGAVISDPQVGDVGKMVVADRDISSVRATKRQANPGSRRKHDMADGTYFGAMLADAPTQWFAWTATGFSVRDKNGNTLVGGPDGIKINGVLIDRSGNIFSPANIKAGDGTGDSVTLQGHDHGGVMSGTGQSSGPVPGT